MLIREDKHGLYIRRADYKFFPKEGAFRPGYFNGYSHAMNTSNGGLIKGDKPKTSNVSGAPFMRITLENGNTLYWGCYGRLEGDFPEEQ